MEEISLRELLENIWKGKWLISIIVIAALLLTAVGTYFMLPDSQRAVTIVEFSFPGIEKGETPDGNIFDAQQIKAPYVIKNALNEMGFADKGIKAEEIRKNIDIVPIIPNDIATKTENMIKQGKIFAYYPSVYKIVYKINKAFSYNEGLQILDVIVKEYSKYFNDLYSDKSTMENVSKGMDYSKYDYPDIVNVMSAQINTVIDFLDSKAKEAGNFRSETTTFTFSDLKRVFTVIRDVDVDRLNSIININNITKNKEKLIDEYRFKIKEMELMMHKKSSEAEETRALMKEFKREDFVLVPDNNGNELKTENPVSYYNELAKRANDASVAAANLKHEIEYYKAEIQRLKSADNSLNTKLMNEVSSLIDSIKKKMTEGIDLVNATLDDYYEYTFGHGIRQISPSGITSSINVKLNLAIALVLGLMIGVFVVFFKEYWKNTAPERPGDISQQG